jgi:hypothetical protein
MSNSARSPRKNVKVTQDRSCDNDGLQCLTPAERSIYERAKSRPDEPFCYLDFEDAYAHGTIRNAFSKLKDRGLIRLYCRSFVAFYVHASSRLKSAKVMTALHKVGGGGVRGVSIDFRAFLESLELEDVCRVHNVVLCFCVDGLYNLVYSEHSDRRVERSGDIPFGSFAFGRGRVLKVSLHRNGRVTCYLRCSDCPIAITIEGLVALSAFLGGVRSYIADTLAKTKSSENVVPGVPKWIVTQWHYGRDGAREISGPAFNVTFSTWCGELARVYMRRRGRLFRARLEVLEKPKKTLPAIFAEKIQGSACSRKQESEETEGDQAG